MGFNITHAWKCHISVVTCALRICLICMPSTLGLRAYISGKSLVPMLQLIHVAHSYCGTFYLIYFCKMLTQKKVKSLQPTILCFLLLFPFLASDSYKAKMKKTRVATYLNFLLCITGVTLTIEL